MKKNNFKKQQASNLQEQSFNLYESPTIEVIDIEIEENLMNNSGPEMPGDIL